MPFSSRANKEIILQKTPENMCFSMIYRTKEKLEIKGIQISGACVLEHNDTDGKSKKAKKQGTIILNHIIKYAKENNFKSIELTDGSTYSCSNTMFKKSYSIPRIHTLCYLEPWHYKYGFRYVDDENNQNVVNNKIILSNMKTHNLRFDLFIGYLYDKMKLEFLEDIVSDKIIILLKDIQIIYSNNYKQPICEFFKELTYKYCDIVSMIDDEIFDLLGLKLSEAERKNKMILKLDKA